MVRVKICGITNLEDAQAACDAGADALGFVFAPEARARNRYIDPLTAKRIVAALPPFITTVAVCVNEAPEKVFEYLQFVDFAQLCGEERIEDCIFVARRVIKGFRTSPEFDPEAMLEFPVAAYLLDAGAPGEHGGSGQRCDWDAARRATTLNRPLILAGGLTPENVAEAVRAVRPYAVDVSGGVESEPGKKDHERVYRFIQNAKQSLP